MKYASNGFTVIELIVTLGIFSFILYLSSVSFINIQKSNLLNDSLWQMAVVIRQSQSNAALGKASAETQLRFGVLFSQNYYQEFRTTSNFASRDSSFDLISNLSKSLQFVNINLPDTCLQVNDCIIFNSISGLPSAGGSVDLEVKESNDKKTISINQQGKVSY